MESELRSIGELARASGLTVSALRFYDGAGVLVPASVDPETGYRWYSDDQLGAARLVVRLRRVGMPLADVVYAIEHWSDPAAVRRLLDRHLRRLEDGLTDARRELSRVHALLDLEENLLSAPYTPTRISLACADLAAGLDAVRFAVSPVKAPHDGEVLPALLGVLLEVEDDRLRFVATDRYRLAVAQAPARAVSGPPVSVIAPSALIDDARALLDDDGEAVLGVDSGEITVQVQGRRVSGQRLDFDYPDYRALIRIEGARQVTVDVARLRESLASLSAAVTDAGDTMAVLTVGRDGSLQVTTDPPASDLTSAGEELRIGVNRGFLLDALTAPGREQLLLELTSPISPLAIRVPGDDRTFSILMPVRLP